MSLLLLYGTALLVGSVHALEPDHMAAVTSFAVRRPKWREAVLFGVRWAVGHGAAIVVVGTGILVVGLRVPDGATDWLERVVGITLVGLGAWTVSGAKRLHAHRHAHRDGTVHEHVHSHAIVKDHDHRHGATLVGVLHGVAGTAPAVALVPITSFETPAAGVFYLVVFAVGTAGGMALYALLAGLIVGRAALGSERTARTLAIVTGCITMAVGVLWLGR